LIVDRHLLLLLSKNVKKYFPFFVVVVVVSWFLLLLVVRWDGFWLVSVGADWIYSGLRLYVFQCAMRQLQNQSNIYMKMFFNIPIKYWKTRKVLYGKKRLTSTQIYIASVTETNKEPILFESFNSLLLQCPIRSRHETMFYLPLKLIYKIHKCMITKARLM